MDTVLRHADPVSILMTVMASGLLLACGGLVILAAIGVRRLLTPARLEAAARALGAADARFRQACRTVTGLRLRRSGLRRASLAALSLPLILGALLGPPVMAGASAGLAAILFAGLWRLAVFDRCEARRLADEGRAAIDPLRTRGECLAGLAVFGFVLAAGSIRAAVDWPAPSLAAPLLPLSAVARELAAAVLPGLAAPGETGLIAAALRAGLGLAVLAAAGILALSIHPAATGRRNHDIDSALRSGDVHIAQRALDRLERRALDNRRTAQLRLVQIAFARRPEIDAGSTGIRLRAATALTAIADRFRDISLALASAQAHRQIFTLLDASRSPVSWAQGHVDFAAAIELAARLSGDVSMLDEAVTALSRAAEVFTEDSAPEQWALIQDRLGGVHALKASRDPAHWPHAIAALREALQLRKRGGLPGDRAATQESLALALLGHAGHSGEQGVLREVIALCRDAQDIHVRAGDLEGSARVRLLMAEGLRELARLTGEASRLQDAEGELSLALRHTPRARHPLAWARLQHLRGTVQRALAARTGDPALLDHAVGAFEAALCVRRPEIDVAEWVETKLQLGHALKAQGEHRREPAVLSRAAACFSEAMAYLPLEDHPERGQGLLFTLGVTVAAEGRLREDSGLLEQAAATLEQAIASTDPDTDPGRWAAAQHALGITLCALGRLKRDPQVLDLALHAFSEALCRRGAEAQPAAHAASQAKMAETLLCLYPLRKDTGLLDRAFDAFYAAKRAFEATGDRDRTAAMVEHLRRIRAVHRAPGHTHDREAQAGFARSA
ncbi:hypothetical protein E5163_01260 [Marinicauda algicola]|uniref:Tetratricopeptide repeat protein n=1 Tax=Marinicauda algicola TaxID=2029849 RepID=A0A4S2H366_9PROT|nr:hypothetical protein [Marinicauda algicola]TGY89798.1 hypothetical protein E5163_01260 [Marinicauda algicola]